MKKLILIALIILLSIQIVFGGVISAKDLAQLVKKENVVIVSARNEADYSKKHIKDAVNLYHNDLYKTEGVDALLKPAEEIAVILGNKGISETSKIVIYDDGENKLAGRIYWILDYLGAQDISILDGHIKSWMKARLPVTLNVTEIVPAVFVPKVNNDIYASMDYVKSNKDKADVILVDVRSADEFTGKAEDEKLQRKGYIPGAINFEYKNIINEDGTIKTREEMVKLLIAAGITSDKEVILYCATSVRAGIIYMALKSMLDYPRVRVYDGAYYEWESVSSNPVE